jgi:hypothetical protein
MNLRESILNQGKFAWLVMGALAGTAMGGIIIPAVFFATEKLISVFDPTFPSSGPPDGPGTVFGIFFAG